MTTLAKNLLFELELHLLDVLVQLLFEKLTFSADPVFEVSEFVKQSFASFKLDFDSSHLLDVLCFLDVTEVNVRGLGCN